MYIILNPDKTRFRTKDDEWWALANWNTEHVLTLVDLAAAERYMKMHGLLRANPVQIADLDSGIPMNFDQMFEELPVDQKVPFAEAVKALFEKHKAASSYPMIVYKTAADQLEVYLTGEPAVTHEAGGKIRVMTCDTRIIGFKLIGLLEAMQPTHDPSMKFMEVPLDVIEVACEAFSAKVGFTFNVEEERFFYWVNIHWPGLREKYPWLANMRG